MSRKNFNDYKINGDVTTIYIKRRNGEVLECYIDTKNLQKLLDIGYSWHVLWKSSNETYYARCSIYKGLSPDTGKPKYEMIYMHHLIKPIQEGEVIDHIDNNTLNNCEENLRIVTQFENTKNRTTKNRNNTSGYRNVSWNESEQKWVVQLQIDGKNTRLGSFKDVHEAGKFAEQKRLKKYGEFAGNG